MDNKLSFAELNSGEQVGMGIIEISTVPDFSIISGKFNTYTDAVLQYKLDMAGLLSEIYQNYKTRVLQGMDCQDLSVELLWLTEAVSNQPYKANISIYIIVRSIGGSQDSAGEAVSELLRLCSSTVMLQKYDCREITYSELSKKLSNIEMQDVRAIVKDERVENLQNQLLPMCYAFDKLPFGESDLSRIVNALIDFPGSAVSFQLMPTAYSYDETRALEQTRQMLDTLSRGVLVQEMGNVSFALAEKHAETYKYYETSKTSPLYSFNILVMGPSAAVSSISTQLYGQLSKSGDESADMKFLPLSAGDVDIHSNFYPLPWAISEIVSTTGRSSAIWSSKHFTNFYRFPYIISVDEASEFFRLPIGSDTIAAGLVINDSAKVSRTYTDNIVNSGDITVGKLKSSQRGDTIGFSLKDLAKHMLVVGTPGSGKTTFSVSLLDRLWKQHHIPFLVIEPAKNEYRALIQSIPDLQVFTPGKNFISPFVFNPFVPPKNVRLETYKSTLKTAFAAAVSMTTPLDKIFEESVNNCYSDFRWLDSYTSDDKGQTFNITDFIKCFQQTFDEIGYTGDAKNIGRAGVVRLNGLAKLFDNYHSIPIEDLLQKPTIIELAAIENSDEKALIISLLLLSILAYVNANYVGEGGLKNVILLEEAHVLLDADSNAGQGDANPSAIAQGLVKRMLAEIRSYGVGLVIADQSPRKVSTDVVALTDMKLVFRLVEATDKQIIADSTNMGEAQAQRLARLKPGEAFFFFNRLDEPEEVITPDYRLENNISITLSDDGIRQLSTYWNSRRELLRPYPECAQTKYCTHDCDFSRRMLAKEIARRIYVRNFQAGTNDFEQLKLVLSQISRLVRDELNDEPFSRELLSCVKVHLWRKVRYGTKIPVTDKQISNSLGKL
ncbi:MAG: ATP-binding protein [Oscillospiraceae bacterium]